MRRIGPKKVAGSPKLPKLVSEPRRRVEGAFPVSHTGFDRGVLDGALERHGLPSLRVTWLDSARIAKLAWPGVCRTGLAALAKWLGIEFRHHAAAEEAMAAARIV